MTTGRIGLSLILLIISGLLVSLPAATAVVPYQGYNYGYWDSAASPAAYLPERVIRGSELGIGDFRAPGDLYAAADGLIYVLDSGNGRIVILDADWQVQKVIDQFTDGASEQKLSNPQGIFVTDNGEIVVADTDNRRVITMDRNGLFLRVIHTPVSDVIRAGLEFFPRKIVIDKTQRTYVIGKGVYDGIMEFDPDEQFHSFIGTNRVRFNPVDHFWKSISTKTQREKMALFLPVEFNNLDLDGDGFIFTTTSERFSSNPLQRLNPSGMNILRAPENGTPRGDLDVAYIGSTMSGPSVFTDIVAGDNGIYSAIDAKRGRIFTYSEDGDLLYIFGQRGAQAGTFKAPVAIERVHDQVLILDKDYNHIVLFKPTAFGQTVNEAVQYYYQGNEQRSEQSWRNVLELNGNYETAHIGIGKALLRQDKYKEAMAYFKNGENRKYYSKAFTLYRKQLLREHFGLGMSVLLAAALFAAAVGWTAKWKRRRGQQHAYKAG